MSITVRRALVATGAAGAMVAGLAAASLIGGAAAGAATTRGAITYRVDSDGQIHGPGHFAPGRIAIKLLGYGSQQFQLMKPYRASYTKQMLVDDANLALQKGNPKPAEANFAFVGGASPHNVSYLSVEPGKYFAFDPNVAKITAKNVRVITVKGARKNATIPNGPTIKATGMHMFANSPASIPNKGTLHFANKAGDWHFIEVDRLRSGKTFKDVQKALKGQEPFEKVFYTGGAHNHFSMAVVSPGRGEAASYSLNKGNYAVLCFFPDHRTGIPHAFEGMARALKVG